MRHILHALIFLCVSALTPLAQAGEPALLTQFVPDRKIEEVVESLRQAIVAHNFTFVREQAIDGRLVPGDWEAKSVRIVYFCNFAKMDAALTLDVRTTQAMPCRITLIERKEGVDLVAVNPAWVSESWKKVEVQQYCLQLKADYLSMLEEVAL